MSRPTSARRPHGQNVPTGRIAQQCATPGCRTLIVVDPKRLDYLCKKCSALLAKGRATEWEL